MQIIIQHVTRILLHSPCQARMHPRMLGWDSESQKGSRTVFRTVRVRHGVRNIGVTPVRRTVDGTSLLTV